MKLLTIPLGALVLLGAAFLIANRWDSPLDPRAARILEAPQPSIAPDQNLHTAVARFGAISIRGSAGELCRFGATGATGGCLESVAGERTAGLRELVEKNSEIEDRYLALRQYPAYFNPDHDNINAPAPPWGSVLLAQQLHLTRLALDAVEGKRTDLDAALAEDHRFWRGLLGSGQAGLLEKMAANTALRGTLVLLGELVRAGKIPPDSGHVATMVAPWTDAQRSLRTPLEMEFRLNARSIGAFSEKGTRGMGVSDPELDRLRPFASFFYLPNATLNALYERSVPVFSAADLPCPELKAAAPGMKFAEDPPWTAYLRNAIGNLLVAVAVPDFSTYMLRQCDLEGLRRVITLQTRVAGAPQGSIESALAAAGTERLDPFTEQPMRWDAGTASVAYEATDPRYRSVLPWRLAH